MFSWQHVLCDLVQNVDEGGSLFVALLPKVVAQLRQLVLKPLDLEGITPQHISQALVANLQEPNPAECQGQLRTQQCPCKLALACSVSRGTTCWHIPERRVLKGPHLID